MKYFGEELPCDGIPGYSLVFRKTEYPIQGIPENRKRFIRNMPRFI
jgi:hypothetical protein